LVGITQTEAALSGAEIFGPSAAFACSSSLTPSYARFRQRAARTRAECSPMPAVNTNDLDVRREQNRAERLEWEAGFAVDYAIAAVEQAKLAVLDAIDGRIAAEVTEQV
jgi:hypothetical protein